MSNLGIIRISQELLRDILLLPEDVEVRHAQLSGNVPQEIEFIISSKTIPATYPGSAIARYSPQYKSTTRGLQTVVEFEGWR